MASLRGEIFKNQAKAVEAKRAARNAIKEELKRVAAEAAALAKRVAGAKVAAEIVVSHLFDFL